MLELWVKGSRTSWVQANFITEDTERLAAAAHKDVLAATTELAHAATRFDELALSQSVADDVARRLKLLKLSLTLMAPNIPARQKELTDIAASLESDYGKGRYCPDGKQGDCLDLNQMRRILANSRDAEQLRKVWVGWRTVSPPMRPRYQRLAELANQGERELGFADLGVLWRSKYDMPPDEFTAEVERLWQQVRPLYEALHAHVRASLASQYGSDLVPEDGLIPAHLLGNMWASSRCPRPSGSARCSPSRLTATWSAMPAPGTLTSTRTCASRCASRLSPKIFTPSITSWGTTSTSAPTGSYRCSTVTAPTTASTKPSATPSPYPSPRRT